MNGWRNAGMRRWRRAIVGAVLACAIAYSPLNAQSSANGHSLPTISLATEDATPSAASPQNRPLDKETKARASFLAGGGLVILTLLGLGAALALVRAFRR